MTTATTAEALMRAILDDPADDLPRLAYADWCEEMGQDERAEFVRAQLAVAAHYRAGGTTFGRPELRRLEDRAADLLASPCCNEWFAPGGGLLHFVPHEYASYRARAVIWRRGFPDEIHVSPTLWRAVGVDLAGRWPIRRVECHDHDVVRSGMIFRGEGRGDIAAPLWAELKLGRCYPTCPTGTPSYERGTHLHFGTGKDGSGDNGVKAGEDFLSERLLAWARGYL